MKKIILYTLLLLFLGSILYANTTIEASKKAIELWLYTLLPSFLFPLIMIRLISPYHLIYNLCLPFKKVIHYLFNIDVSSFELILTSLFLGFPSASIFINEQIKDLPNELYNRFLYIPFMASPNFILLSLSAIYDTKTTFKLFYIQVFTIFILLFLSRKNCLSLKHKKKYTAFFSLLTNSIQNSFTILFSILAYILLIYVCIDLISIVIPELILVPIKILTEFASGCFFINTLCIPDKFKLIITTLLLSYGGLCVHLQVISSLSSKFNYFAFMKVRLKHMIISACLAFFIF